MKTYADLKTPRTQADILAERIQSLKGVYGLKAGQVDREPAWVWHQAREAWELSALGDITNGATHWENIKAFGKPKWAEKMIQTYAWKDHVFYKEPKK